MATVKRYLVERAPDQIKTAFQGIVDLCGSEGIARVTLVGPQKGGWDRTMVAEFLGPAITKALLKGQPVQITKGTMMTFESAQTFRGNSSHGLIVGAHISTKDMAKIDDSWDAKAIMFLPWGEAEGKEWQATWKPETLGTSTWTAPASTLTAPVEDALKMLTGNINLGSGLGHPSDKALAVKVIARLRAEGHALIPLKSKGGRFATTGVRTRPPIWKQSPQKALGDNDGGIYGR